MRRFVVIFALCVLCAHGFAAVISWKGMELGSEPNPAWLRALTKENDERAARRKFGIDATFRIFLGVGTDASLENARGYASADCMRKVLAAEKADEKILAGLSPVYEFWTRDETGYTVYALFKLQAR